MTTLEFSAMVQKYQSLVYTVCHQLVPDAGDAQDLTQETFLAAWRAIDRCPPGFEKQWLARIAANKAKDYLRSAWVRRVNIPGDDVLVDSGKDVLCFTDVNFVSNSILVFSYEEVNAGVVELFSVGALGDHCVGDTVRYTRPV